MNRQNQDTAARERSATSEGLLQVQLAALNAAANAILIADRRGSIQWVNPAFTRLTGYQPEEVLGQNPRMLKSDQHDNRFYQEMWKTVSSGAVWQGEVVNRRKDQSLYVEQMTITPVRSSAGEITHFVAIKEDVTTRKNAEDALRRSTEKLEWLSRIVESSNDAIIGITFDGTVTSWNRGAEKLYGYSSDEVLGRSYFALVPEEGSDWLRGVLKRLGDGEKVAQYEAVRRRKDGKQVDVAVTISSVMDSAGVIIGVSAISRDITERKRAEKEIAHQASFPQLNPNPVMETDLQGNITFANEAAKKRFPKLFESDDRHPVLAEWESIRTELKSGRSVSMVREVRSGTAVYLQTVHYVPELQVVRCYFTDVTERQRALAALEKGEEQLSLVIKAADLGTWDWNIRSGLLEWSPRSLEMFGIPSGTIMNYPRFLQSLHVDDRERVDQAVRNALERHEEYDVEMRALWPDGSVHWISSRGRAYYDESGQPIRMSGSVHDITERKKVELALQEREKQLQAVLDILPVALFICDANGKMVRANPAANKLWGGAVPLVHLPDYHEYKGRLPGENRDFESKDWALVRAVQNGEITVNQEVEIETFDGKRRTILNSALPIRDDKGRITGAVAMNLDITDLKLAERALVRSEKLASVGRMAATIAHEINNPLAAAVNALFLARTDPTLPDSVRGDIQLAEQELARVAHISKQTLGFYREVGTPTAINLPDIVESILNLYSPRMKNKDISVKRRYRTNACARAIDGEVRQIASNLVSNGIDALPEDGVLHVRVLGPQALRNYRRMVRLTIADNGEGISAENVKHVFEPFFTTKQAVGTGLGLWVTHELVKKHEGRIRLRSRAGKGTVIMIWLPVERRAQERRSA